MRHLQIVPLAALLLAPTFGQEPDLKLRGDLPEVLATTPTDGLVPVTVVLANHATTAELHALAAGLSKAERRRVVVEHLKAVAAASQVDLLAFLQERGAQDVRELWIHNVVGAKVTPAVVHELAARADVEYVHRNVILPIEEVLTGAPAPAPAGDPTCGVELIRAPEVWAQRGITGDGVVVAVIDTGVCTAHSDIDKRLWTNPGEVPGNGQDDDGNGFVDDVRGWDFEFDSNDVSDNNGHGSHVTGTVAGDGTAGTACGVAPGARIMTLRFVNQLSTVGEQSVWDSMQYAVDNGADVQTASLGWPHNSGPDRATWRMVCENAIATGLVVIYAAGNEGGSVQNPDNVRTPGDVPDVICVGSVDCSDTLSGFSSRGPVTWENVPPYNDHPFPPGYKKPDVVAEGDGTFSHSFCSAYTQFAGTSMATPHVAGAAALILQADPTLDHFGVKSALETTALDLGVNNKDNRFGWGRIDTLLAVDQVLGGFCVPKATSCGPPPIAWTEGDSQVGASSGFEVLAGNMPGSQVALFIYTDQGGANTPLLGGNLCVASILRGLPVQTSGTTGQCDGVAAFDMNAFAAGALGGFPAGFLSVPGTTVHGQWWGRDPANSFTAVLTGGVTWTIAP